MESVYSNFKETRTDQQEEYKSKGPAETFTHLKTYKDILLKTKHNIKVLFQREEVLQERTKFSLDIDIGIFCAKNFMKIKAIIEELSFSDHENINRFLKNTDNYTSKLFGFLTLEDIQFISEFTGYDFVPMYKSLHSKDHQIADWMIIQLFDFDQQKKIEYFTAYRPKYMTANEKEKWDKFPFNRYESGLSDLYNVIIAKKYLIIEYIKTIYFLNHFEYFCWSLFMDSRGRIYYLASLFCLETKFILYQVMFYVPNVKIKDLQRKHLEKLTFILYEDFVNKKFYTGYENFKNFCLKGHLMI